jgi:GNAT superfamily N-acetyltransferase
MIRHIVLIRFKDHLDEAAIGRLFDGVKAVQSQIPGMLSVSAGRSLELEKLEKGFRHGFVVEFEDRAALDAYQVHPDHRRVGAQLVEAAEGGLDGILVFDLED